MTLVSATGRKFPGELQIKEMVKTGVKRFTIAAQFYQKLYPIIVSTQS